MKGWKTKAGATLTGVGVALRLLGYEELGDALASFGAILMGVGVAHKIEKAAANK